MKRFVLYSSDGTRISHCSRKRSCGVNFPLNSSTGRVYLDLNQVLSESLNETLRIFNLHTTTGKVDVSCDLESNYGISIDASCVTGSIYLPNGESNYSSYNYYQYTWKYYFDLSTTTGSVEFN